MGTLRTLLAISVVLGHSGCHGGQGLVGMRNAVQIFYLISGFLISYVLHENPAYRNPIRFYVSRALRLYPTYYVVAAMMLAATLTVAPSMLGFYATAPAHAVAMLVAVNVLIFGQEWVLFLGIDHGHIGFAPDPALTRVPMWTGLLVPQAWTLGVEWSFYLIAPFVLRRPKAIVFLLLGSLVLRGIAIAHGIGRHDPWTYRFFPFELALFLAGALSHRWLLPFWTRVQQRRRFRCDRAATALVVVACLLGSRVSIAEPSRGLALLIAVLLLLPLLFQFQRSHRVDRVIGELSYPIYVGHLLVIWLVRLLASRISVTSLPCIAAANVAGSLALAACLSFFVARPIERWRVRFGAGATLRAPQ